MRCLTAIFLSLLLQLVGFAQMVRADDHGIQPSGDECCSHEHSSPSSGDAHGHGCPEDANCPMDGEHCHHHGTCTIHGAFLAFSFEKSMGLRPPESRELFFDPVDFRAEEGPVLELDKPPLI